MRLYKWMTEQGAGRNIEWTDMLIATQEIENVESHGHIKTVYMQT